MPLFETKNEQAYINNLVRSRVRGRDKSYVAGERSNDEQMIFGSNHTESFGTIIALLIDMRQEVADKKKRLTKVGCNVLRRDDKILFEPRDKRY